MGILQVIARRNHGWIKVGAGRRKRRGRVDRRHPHSGQVSRLKRCLQGNALRAISLLNPEEEFYDPVIKIIKDEFGSVFFAQYAYASELVVPRTSKFFHLPEKWYTLIPIISQNVKALGAKLPMVMPAY